MNLVVTHWLPGALTEQGYRLPATPCPDLLTADEAVRYLRLDETGVSNPKRTLDRYREAGLVEGRRIGRCVVYRREDLDKFVNDQEQSA